MVARGANSDPLAKRHLTITTIRYLVRIKEETVGAIPLQNNAGITRLVPTARERRKQK
jgi:hypothetical protein